MGNQFSNALNSDTTEHSDPKIIYVKNTSNVTPGRVEVPAHISWINPRSKAEISSSLKNKVPAVISTTKTSNASIANTNTSKITTSNKFTTPNVLFVKNTKDLSTEVYPRVQKGSYSTLKSHRKSGSNECSTINTDFSKIATQISKTRNISAISPSTSKSPDVKRELTSNAANTNIGISKIASPSNPDTSSCIAIRASKSKRQDVIKKEIPAVRKTAPDSIVTNSNIKKVAPIPNDVTPRSATVTSGTWTRQDQIKNDVPAVRRTTIPTTIFTNKNDSKVIPVSTHTASGTSINSGTKILDTINVISTVRKTTSTSNFTSTNTNASNITQGSTHYLTTSGTGINSGTKIPDATRNVIPAVRKTASTSNFTNTNTNVKITPLSNTIARSATGNIGTFTRHTTLQDVLRYDIPALKTNSATSGRSRKSDVINKSRRNSTTRCLGIIRENESARRRSDNSNISRMNFVVSDGQVNRNDKKEFKIPMSEVKMPSGIQFSITLPSKPKCFCKTFGETKFIKIWPNSKLCPGEHQMLCDEMNNTIKQHVSGTVKGYRIISIQKIKNCCLWTKYMNRRWDITKEVGEHNLNERMLFHGSAAADDIVKTGFDERHSDSGGMFGAGVYFAKHSSKSNQYCFGGVGKGCPSHGQYNCEYCERKMILCRVVLGNILIRYAADKMSHPPPGYHSVMGTPGIGLNKIP